ncbi:MAG TPA: hypothetical protein VN700_18060 [Vicinamibacterales bacterium]|nr:hypothetical protein [Vicinamibacterales bacterium]
MTVDARLEKLVAALPAVLFIASVGTFVQSYLFIKLACLALFLIGSAVVRVRQNDIEIYPRIAWFFLVLCGVGILAAIVGYSNGNSTVAVAEGLRLRVAWSLAFIIIFTLIRSDNSIGSFHSALVLAGILISVINIIGVVDAASLRLIPSTVRKELEMFVGFHDGYTQITSNNIGTLFLIAPYLVSLQFRADAAGVRSGWTNVALVLCLVVAAMSGRRGLWVVLTLTPILVLGLSILTRSVGSLRPVARRLLVAYTLAAVIGGGLFAFTSIGLGPVGELGAVARFRSAFSSQDIRAIQRRYLLDAFMASPWVGSGFGGYAGYLRNAERPWSYELTYHQMLFNIGIVGTTALVLVFGVYLIRVVRLLTAFRTESAIPFCLLIGLVGLCMGAYSNPYLGSFDYLFFVGLLPYLSTFGRGFGPSSAPAPAAGTFTTRMDF